MKNKSLVLIILTLSAAIVAAIICHYKGDEWEEEVRSLLYTINRDSVPSFATEMVDEKGIPYVYYAPQNGISAGTKYNATIVCNYAIQYINQYSDTKDSTNLLAFNNCIEWLSTNMHKEDNYALYRFNWQQPWYPSVKAPFTSGMTSGRAIEAFTLAYLFYHDNIYLDYANQLLRGYFIPIQHGGFTYKDSDRWWYEEVADTNLNTPKILDGHIYAIQGVQKLWLITKQYSARLVIKNGLNALKQSLPEYDAGNGAIFYDADKKIADKKYHKILTGQMLQLYKTTGDPLFQHYYEKWNAPMQRTYVVRIFKEWSRSGIILFFMTAVLIGMILFIGYKVLNSSFEKRKILF